MNGHYDVDLTYIEPNGTTFTKTARVSDFDRDRPAVDLVAAALSVVNPLKRGMASFDDRLARYDPAVPYAGEVWAETQPVGREFGAPHAEDVERAVVAENSKPVSSLKGIVSKPRKPVSVEDMAEASGPLEQLRGTVKRYDNPTDPVGPSNDKTGTP